MHAASIAAVDRPDSRLSRGGPASRSFAQQPPNADSALRRSSGHMSRRRNPGLGRETRPPLPMSRTTRRAPCPSNHSRVSDMSCSYSLMIDEEACSSPCLFILMRGTDMLACGGQDLSSAFSPLTGPGSRAALPDRAKPAHIEARPNPRSLKHLPLPAG
jgi:hypothetical protein